MSLIVAIFNRVCKIIRNGHLIFFKNPIKTIRVRQSAGAWEQCSKAASSLVGSRGKKRRGKRKEEKKKRKKRKEQEKKGEKRGKKGKRKREKKGKKEEKKRKRATKKKKTEKENKNAQEIKDCIVHNL